MPSPTLPWRVLRAASFLPVPILTATTRGVLVENMAGRELETTHAETKQERGREGLFLCAATSNSAAHGRLLRRPSHVDWLCLFFWQRRPPRPASPRKRALASPRPVAAAVAVSNKQAPSTVPYTHTTRDACPSTTGHWPLHMPFMCRPLRSSLLLHLGLPAGPGSRISSLHGHSSGPSADSPG